jgi:hypothetical protein
MGTNARSLTPLVALAALGQGLADHGATVSVGDGVEAALEVLSQPDEAFMSQRA